MDARLFKGPSHCWPRSCPSLPTRAHPFHPLRKLPLCHSQSPGDEASLREQAKRLDQLFYGSNSNSFSSSNSTSSAEDATTTSSSTLHLPLPSIINDLPLWRVQWSVLPSNQEVLHVHVPHYVDLFNRLFSGPRPWRFGHLYLPGGSASLGSDEFSMQPGSKGPLAGTLMEVIQAVRFPDGRLLILAAGLGRFKVINGLQSVPHSRADVMLLPDAEELSAAEDAAMKALESLSENELAVARAMKATEAATQHAATTAAAYWWNYELVHCRVHERLAVIDSGDDETAAMQFGRRLVNIGNNEVIEMPWAVQTGFGSQLHPPVHFDEAASLRESDIDASKMAEIAAEELIRELEKCSETSWREVESFLRGRFIGLNTISERGVSTIVSVKGLEEESSSLEAANWEESTSSSATAKEYPLKECLRLEEQVWEELDKVRILASKISGRTAPLAEGLLCLRPKVELRSNSILGPSAAATAHDESPEWTGEGAHPQYPALRRIQRLSFALASSLGDVSASEGRQAWLEVNSIAGRLRLGLAALRRHRGVLAAVVAVRNLASEDEDTN